MKQILQVLSSHFFGLGVLKSVSLNARYSACYVAQAYMQILYVAF